MYWEIHVHVIHVLCEEEKESSETTTTGDNSISRLKWRRNIVSIYTFAIHERSRGDKIVSLQHLEGKLMEWRRQMTFSSYPRNGKTVKTKYRIESRKTCYLHRISSWTVDYCRLHVSESSSHNSFSIGDTKRNASLLPTRRLVYSLVYISLPCWMCVESTWTTNSCAMNIIAHQRNLQVYFQFTSSFSVYLLLFC